ncbi:outer membrane lipoprotein-sorting protein [Salinispira pacifica]|uniref:Outer membrane lipoprotein-sorting protein n=1 Tax=Salinispira pacifica TaxID=1307761 RepID=V5WJ68_9SPIO|nr:outer membrane lipoprotein-sorting protein [Salinispira pacifica]AHC15584.1 Outer membrane lipoprotein-sorting protein [Salinispira pacifica]
MHKRIAIITVLLILGLSSLWAQFERAEEIILEMEDQEVFDSAYIQGKMIINDRFGEKVSTFDSWSLGSDYSLIEFTSVEERGQKILRNDDDLYLYYPDADEVIRLSGAALRDGILGSDVSYEDMTGDKSLLADYRVSGFEEDRLTGKDVYVVELEALRSSVPYQKQILWIEQDRLVGMQAHKFSLSGRLLKVERVLEYRAMDEYLFPVHIVTEDKLKQNSSTEFIIEEIDLDYPLDRGFFSLDELTW